MASLGVIATGAFSLTADVLARSDAYSVCNKVLFYAYPYLGSDYSKPKRSILFSKGLEQ